MDAVEPSKYLLGLRPRLALSFLLAACLILAAARAVADEADALEQIGPAVREEIKAGRIPGAVVLVGSKDRILYRRAFGLRSIEPRRAPMTPDTIFDLASLTKVLATTPAIMQLVEAGRLKLDAPVADYWPQFARNGKEAITLVQLLTHTSGLAADLDLRQAWRGESEAEALVEAAPCVSPPGSAFRYSDINFLALGMLVRKVTGERLDRFAERHVFAPLGMRRTGFRPSPRRLPLIAPTDREEGRLRWGIVQDPTSYRMGGIAGHAGLFGTADDLSLFARALLSEGRLRQKSIMGAETMRVMTAPRDLPGGFRRGLGWDMTSPFAGGEDMAFGEGSYGHTGYTGTSLWIDPRHDRYLIILTSRLHPDHKGDARPLRAHLAQIVAASVSPVQSGIDVLEAENFAPLAGLRIGLLTNRTGRDAQGRRSIDVLSHAPGVDLLRIFTPEHGLAGQSEGAVASGMDEATGLPVVSLYGSAYRPSPEALSGLDAIVVDIQDAGARFYTYPATMAFTMAAAAQAGVRVFVLDRPNPVTAATVEGPVPEAPFRKLTNYFAMPVRHGMTLGELARMFNEEERLGADLTVIAMAGYKRGLWYDQTGLPWVAPSPNLRSVEEAALYPGVAMIEGANVSVGRGTQTPFELVGAPWIDGAALKRDLDKRAIAGVRFSPADFTPAADAYSHQICHGVEIAVTDRQALNSPVLGLELAASLYRLYPERFRIDDTRSLFGGQQTIEAIKAAVDPRTIAEGWQAGGDAFATVRARYLLYP